MTTTLSLRQLKAQMRATAAQVDRLRAQTALLRPPTGPAVPFAAPVATRPGDHAAA